MSKKYKYPLTAAVAMGASGTRCPQIIEEPTDRRVPLKVELAEGYYILHYSEVDIFKVRRGAFFDLSVRDRPRGGMVPNSIEKSYLVGEQGPEPIIRGVDMIYKSKAAETAEEKVYNARLWTGREPSKPSPDLTLAEAWADLEVAIEEVFSKSWLLSYLRTFVAIEKYIDDDNKLRSRTRFILAIGRRSREDIKKAILWRNARVEIRFRFISAGKCFRDLGRAASLAASGILKNFSTKLKEAL